MRTVLVIMGIVVILALVSLPGAAIMSKADLFASYMNSGLDEQYVPPGPDDYADDLPSCGDCEPEVGTYCCDSPASGSMPAFIHFPPTPTVEGSMKVTERHIPQLPPYIPSWVTIGFF